MNNVPPSPPSPVPSIHILSGDDIPTLFHGGDMFPTDMRNFYDFVPDEIGLYTYSRGLRAEYLPPSELEAISDLSHLATMDQAYITDHGYSLPHSTILQENTTADRCPSPSSLGSSVPSPTSISLSTPDQQFLWPTQSLKKQSSDSLELHPSHMSPFSNDLFLPHGSPGPATRRHPKLSPSSRRKPVASKAMRELNSRCRRRPAQFKCEDCNQTFTALFSLKRHARSHTCERPFACSIPGCSQRFYNSSDCKRHEKSKKCHKDLVMQ